MAAGSSVINVAILGDAKQFKRAVGEAGDKLSRFGSKVGTVSANVVKGFGVMGAAAGGLAVVVGKQLFDVGEELTALDQKIGTVFSGSSLDTVTGWADEVAARMGLTSTQAAGLAANAGDLLKPMGFTADEAANMSTEIIGLAGALSEWSGGQRSVEETAEILSKALLGERDSLKSLGISINQAEVDQRALTIAQQEGRDAITAQDKALATQALILEKSTDAQEAYAAGGNKLTAAQNRLRAAFGEVQERLARKLLPLFAKAADIVVELIEVFDKDGLGGVISNVSKRIKDAWPMIRMQLGVWARGFVDWVRQVGPPFLAALGNLLLRFGSWFIDDALPVIIDKLQEWAQAFIDWIGPLIPPFISTLGELIARFAEWFIGPGLNMIVTKLGEWAAAFLEWVGPLIPPLLRELGNLLVRIGTWIVSVGLPLLAGNIRSWADALVDWIIDVAPDVIIALGGLLWSMASYIGRAAKDLGEQLIDKLVEGIKAAPGKILNAIRSLLPSGGILGSIGNALVQGLAAGGPVVGNTPYIVGEAGPELFVPTGSGTIMNNNRLGGMGGGGGDTFNITVNVPTGNGDDVVRALQDYVRRRGAIPVPVGSARY
jgi:hypothetical protein